MTMKTMLIFGRLMRYVTWMRCSYISLLPPTIFSVLLSAIVYSHILSTHTHYFYSLWHNTLLFVPSFILLRSLLSLLLLLSSSR
ncbi:hypothetical protein DFJ58DRAFT_761903 [Suillus subalutaceus]|uniref:uncharacterized protein n=1 Tax=Suillus subalutaceus TaxID=48586 RepID=UPI001B85B653|nr:uncharacterized protein DFJ58DRAFT_761903 [Suillus subalutaceus]KAG1872487.1 hypothetical protein DFJ58DRAFT_761903 [Suillus subalutaceus]